MTDERLRALERAFEQSGSLEDEAAWHAERLRAGRVSRERLELAAALGQPAAQRLCPGVEPVGSATELADRIELAGASHALPRLALAALAALEKRGATHDVEWAYGHSVLLGCLEAQIACPCEEHRAALAAVDLSDAALYRRVDAPPDEGARRWQDGVRLLREAVEGDAPRRAKGVIEIAAGELRLHHSNVWWQRLLSRGVELFMNAAIQSAVLAVAREELLPWLLGTGDPVRPRIAKQGDTEIRPEGVTE